MARAAVRTGFMTSVIPVGDGSTGGYDRNTTPCAGRTAMADRRPHRTATFRAATGAEGRSTQSVVLLQAEHEVETIELTVVEVPLRVPGDLGAFVLGVLLPGGLAGQPRENDVRVDGAGRGAHRR